MRLTSASSGRGYAIRASLSGKTSAAPGDSSRSRGPFRIKRVERHADRSPVGWRDRLLRMLARGVQTRDGRRLDTGRLLVVLDRIDADPEISERLDALEEAELLSELLDLYEDDGGDA